MRVLLLALMGLLVVAGGALALRGTPPATPSAGAGPALTGDKAAVGRIVREYLLANPEVLVEAMQELEKKQEAQREAQAGVAIRQYEGQLLRDPDSPVGGNPYGDVAIVEFVDYQCGYCKRAHAAVKAVLAADPKVRVIYKDLPILGDASRVAALAALAARPQGKYLAFHDALMESRTQLDRTRILAIAESVGIDVARLEKDMQDPKVQQVIDRNMALANLLGVRGTPAFVVGRQFVPGAIDANALRQLIAEARRG